jgi:dihydroxy-acid dehydratase
MLYAAGVPDKEAMAKSPHVGIASVWWEGNPCNMHLMDLAKTAKKAVSDQGMIGWQYNTIGVSDAISMGSEGMHWATYSIRLYQAEIRVLTHAQVCDFHSNRVRLSPIASRP